jgi:hypothetical protein
VTKKCGNSGLRPIAYAVDGTDAIKEEFPCAYDILEFYVGRLKVLFRLLLSLPC